jgi:hypothetical protein
LTSRSLRLGAALTLLVLGSACAQIFDIEDAAFDPTLAEDGSGGATNTGGGGNESGATGGATNTGGSSGSAAGGSGGSSGASGTSGTSGGTETGGASGAAQGGSSSGGSAGDSGAGNEPLPLCERYCEAVMSNCKGRYEQYRNFQQCMSTCEALPPGSAGDDDVNTIECRLRQAEFAESEPFVYCKSSGPLGAGKCGSNCVSYCGLMMATCTAESTAGVTQPAYFEDNESCLAACSAITPGETAPTEYTTSSAVEPVSFVGNHVYCRTYHLGSAIAEAAPDEHCPHAMGADPCIDP